MFNDIISEILKTFSDSGPWLLFGFLAAGLIYGFIPGDFVASHLGRGRFAPIFKAALFGVPLPVCSCAVVPTALGLRAKGAGKPAILSFLVSTPESGVDSILLTSALMDPLMTVARPFCAFFSAVVAGVSEAVFGEREEEAKVTEVSLSTVRGKSNTFFGILAEGVSFAFGPLYLGIAPWLFGGLILAGVITAVIPEGFFLEYVGTGFQSHLLMLAVGIPMYICASASTPVAAAMIAKGLSPGAALVFLLAGPATNAASIMALSRVFGKKTTVRYLLSIGVSALLMGWLLDAVYAAMKINPSARMGTLTEALPEWVGALCAVTLALVWFYGAYKKRCLSRRTA